MILAGGLALRLWGIAFAPSTPVGRPDEEIFSVEALAMFTRPCNRLATGWPDGYFMVWHALLWLQRAWFRLRYGASVNLGCLVAVDPLAVYLPARVLSAVLGTATAWVVGRTAAALAPENARDVALWAAAIYAFNYLVGRDGHFGVTDALLCFEIAIVLFCCAQAGARGPRWLIAAAFAAGLAFSTKYTGAALVIPCAVVALQAIHRDHRRAAAALALVVVAGAAGVLLASPHLPAQWSAFREGLTGHLVRYDAGPTPPGAIYFPAVVLPAAFGWPGLLLCLGGLVWCVRARRGAFLIAYVGFFYAVVLGPLHRTFVRYASPLVPALAVAGGVAAASIVARWPQRRLVHAALALVVLAIPAVRLGAFDRLMARPDTRDLARDWLTARGAGTIVLTHGVYAQVHAVDASVAAVCRRELPAALWRPAPIAPAPIAPFADGPGLPAGSINMRWLPIRFAARPAPADAGPAGWEQIGFLGSTRFVVWEQDQRRGYADLHARVAPDYRARARGPSMIGAIVGDRPVPPAPDEACWTLATRISPGALDAATWDPNDAFLTPFGGFANLEHAGPEITIDKNICKDAGPPP